MSAKGPPPLLPLDRIALFLDFDGTLVELAPRPGDVVVHADLPPVLERLLLGLDGALAVVSGRPLEDLDRLLAPLHLPAAGTHGGEIRQSAGGTVQMIGEALPADLKDRLNDVVKELQAQWHGILLEDKISAVAVHYRLAPAAEPALRAALEALPLPEHWEILPGHCMYEIRRQAQNKGAALRSMCAGLPFAGRLPVMVGDDRTDLDGIAAAVGWGGQGIAVGGLEAPGAAWALPDVAAVQDWLRRLAG